MAIGSFVCSDLGQKIGSIIDLKDFGKYKIISIEEYDMDHININCDVRPLFLYTLELMTKCSRELPDMKMRF